VRSYFGDQDFPTLLRALLETNLSMADPLARAHQRFEPTVMAQDLIRSLPVEHVQSLFFRNEVLHSEAAEHRQLPSRSAARASAVSRPSYGRAQSERKVLHGDGHPLHQLPRRGTSASATP
jgi:hypothetical protein